MTKDEAIVAFGFDPEMIGNRYRSWWIVDKIDDEERAGNAEIGFLCVRTRDGASNPLDIESVQIPNYVGTAEDTFDVTYRYYYYRPIGPSTAPAVYTKEGERP